MTVTIDRTSVTNGWSRVTMVGASLTAALAGCAAQPGGPIPVSPSSWSAVTRSPIVSNQSLTVSEDTVLSAVGSGANYFVMFGPNTPGAIASGTPQNSFPTWMHISGSAYLVGGQPQAATQDVSIITKGTAIAIQIVPTGAQSEIQRVFLLNPVNGQYAEIATTVGPARTVRLEGVESFVELSVNRATNNSTLGSATPVDAANEEVKQFVRDIKARATAKGLPSNTITAGTTTEVKPIDGVR